MNTKSHWEKVFTTKKDSDKSWYEVYPATSINLISELGLARNSSIIDVGGGDSHLVDALLKKEFSDITVLDISDPALQNAKSRLGKKANEVNWIVSDVLNFSPTRQYDCWHDRAVFHFITAQRDIHVYINKMIASIKPGGHLILATFSENGPDKCSGLPVTRYSQQEMTALLAPYFEKIKCIEDSHVTPFNTVQPFTYCGFSKK